MKIPYFVASILAAAAMATPAAYSSPPEMQIIKFKGYVNRASGCFQENINDFYISACFEASAYDEFDTGERVGVIDLSWNDSTTSTYYEIRCGGPSYADVVSVHQGTGNTSIKATLDPLAMNCYDYGGNIPSPVTVQLTGQYNGNERQSQIGIYKLTYGGKNYKSNSKLDAFSEIFTGSNGFYSGNFSGVAATERQTSLTKE